MGGSDKKDQNRQIYLNRRFTLDNLEENGIIEL